MKQKKIKIKLFYKIFTLIAIINIIIIVLLMYLFINNYKTTMYSQLIKNSNNIFDFLIQNFQTQIKTGSFNTKALHPNKIIYLFSKLFKREDSISYIFFYNNSEEQYLIYPEINSLRQEIEKTDLTTLFPQKNQIYNLRYNNKQKLIIHSYKLYDNHKNYIGVLELALKTDHIIKSISVIIKKIIIVSIILLILSLIISYIFAYILLRPINKLMVAVKKIIEGNLETRAEIITNDEIGALADEFNYMTNRLESEIKNLNALQLLSVNISSKLDKENLSSIIIHTFSSFFKSKKCVLMLYNEKYKNYFIAGGLGLSNYNIEFDFSCGLLKKVCETKEILFSKNEENCNDIFNLFNINKTSENLNFLIVPLSIDNKLQGIIILLQNNIKYNESQKSFIKLLSNHCVTALENSRLYELAIKDGLTNIFLKRYFMQKLEEYINNYNLFKSIALVMVDIDFFKKVNDTFGHQEGDIILKEVAKILKLSIRNSDVKNAEREPDLLARYGGEEFSIILFNSKNETLKIILERIRKNVDSHVFKGEKQNHHITISLGCCSFIPGMTGNDLIEKADQALYKSKETGRNKFTIYSEEE